MLFCDSMHNGLTLHLKSHGACLNAIHKTSNRGGFTSNTAVSSNNNNNNNNNNNHNNNIIIIIIIIIMCHICLVDYTTVPEICTMKVAQRTQLIN